MKLVTYLNKMDKQERIGLFHDGRIYDLNKEAEKQSRKLPPTMIALLEGGEKHLETARQIQQAIEAGSAGDVIAPDDLVLLAPVPRPPSCRDAYAFRQHVATARRNRGVDMIPEFDQFPIFYFTNHNSIVGGGELVVEDDHLLKLDFELEAAIVIGKHGRNISAKDADQYIAGYTIMNDFSARQLQMEEMKLNLGPAKGKDFATAIGPWLVTTDELEHYKQSTPDGDKYDLHMAAWHNGTQISDGNMSDMNWTFAEIIERVSYGVNIYPGDVIGSGTVGTGCYLELNGTRTLEAKERGETYEPVWLKDGDEIKLEIAGLGILTHTIVKSSESRSILARKKNI